MKETIFYKREVYFQGAYHSYMSKTRKVCNYRSLLQKSPMKETTFHKRDVYFQGAYHSYMSKMRRKSVIIGLFCKRAL